MSELWARVRGWIVGLVYVLVAINIALNVEGSFERISTWYSQSPALANSTNGEQNYTLGIEYAANSSAPGSWLEIAKIYPGTAAEDAGLQPGDRLRFEDPLGARISYQLGETVMAERDRGGELSEVVLTVNAFTYPEEFKNPFLYMGLLMLSLTAFAVLLLTRGRHSRAARMLGLFFVTFSLGSPLAWFPHWAHTPIIALIDGPLRLLPAYCLLAFAQEISGGGASRKQTRLVIGLGAAFALYTALTRYGPFIGLHDLSGLPNLWLPLVIFASAIATALIGWNYRKADAQARNRIKVVLAAFACFPIGFAIARLLDPIIGAQSGAITFLGFVGLLVLLAYSTFAQRLFDFGFAINRTLVYGAAAFTLLVTFGLVEYIAKSMIPVAWPTAGPFISAGIAVLLFLSFHRLHHWFEHHIERFFFKEWQDAEQALKRFVQSASHFDKMPALCSSAIEAVSKFAEGAKAALYLRGSDGSYRLEAGQLDGAPETYTDDSPAFALMKAERKPLEGEGELPGELALPMLEQGVLAGFILLEGKSDGTHYRPDQIAQLD